MTDSVAVVQEFYSALRAGDVERALTVLSPDLEWTEAEGFPYYSGTWRGPQAVVDKLLQPLARDWAVFSVTAHEFLAMEERVVSFGTYAGTFRKTGRSMSAPFAHRWVVRDGKIVRFNMYTDTVKVLEAMSTACSLADASSCLEAPASAAAPVTAKNSVINSSWLGGMFGC